MKSERITLCIGVALLCLFIASSLRLLLRREQMPRTIYFSEGVHVLKAPIDVGDGPVEIRGAGVGKTILVSGYDSSVTNTILYEANWSSPRQSLDRFWPSHDFVTNYIAANAVAVGLTYSTDRIYRVLKIFNQPEDNILK